LALAGERADGIGAVSQGIAVVGPVGTFVDIGAGAAIPSVAALTGAGEGADGVGTDSIDVTIVCSQNALVFIIAKTAGFIITWIAIAPVTALSVDTIRISRARVGPGVALIDIIASLRIHIPVVVVTRSTFRAALKPDIRDTQITPCSRLDSTDTPIRLASSAAGPIFITDLITET
jgi:hypothetical protein